MLRVIAGSARGRRLRTLPGRGTRPTSDRVKEALFNILGRKVEGARVLDLYAGTGNLGIEALSRGAAAAVFVDSNPACRRLIAENLAALGWADRGRVVEMDAAAAVRLLGRRGERFDLVFVDPPYERGLIRPTLAAMAEGGVLAPGGIAVVEHSPREGLEPLPRGWELADRRRYGATLVSFVVESGRERSASGELANMDSGVDDAPGPVPGDL